MISNDTHDLETMILRGDNELVEHISNSSENSEVISKAKFMAYKLSLVYLILKNNVPGNVVLKAKYYNIEKYFDGINLNVQKYFDYLVYCYKNSKDRNDKSIMNSSKKLYAKFEQALEKEKHLNKEFKMTYDQFLRNEPKEFWQRINGHDISQLILYFNLNNPRFEKHLFKKKNFESFLIDNYNYNNFIKEPLYDKMRNYKILN